MTAKLDEAKEVAANNYAMLVQVRAERAELVSRLRSELIETDKMMAYGSRDDIHEWKDANRNAGNRIRSLLVRLGEVA